MQGASFGTAERLYFLTLMLYECWNQQGQNDRTRALLETALSVLSDPAYRTQLHGMMARHAARLQEFEAANYWLALCDSLSEDIFVDSGYRHTAAFIATMHGDYQRVLQVLGSRVSDAPISTSHEATLGVLRANALEKTGNVEEAVQQLQHWMDKEGTPHIAKILGGVLTLCEKSFAMAGQRQMQMVDDVVKTRTGANVRVLIGIVLVLTIVGAVFASEYVPHIGRDKLWLVGIFSIGLFSLVPLLGNIKRASIRERLKKCGVQGVATLLSIEGTGIEINGRPQLRLQLRVQSPGQPTFLAEHKQCVSGTELAQLIPGSKLGVLYDPNERSQLILHNRA